MPRWFYRLVMVAAVVIIFVIVVFNWPKPQASQTVWGATFNPAYATFLGLDWKQTFTAAQELGIKKWRISVLWDQIEPRPDEFDFSQVDWMLDEVAKNHGEVSLAIGRRTPRWPECHDPAWLKQVPKAEQDDRVLGLLAMLVQKYRNNQVITSWQLENEMSLNVFGDCPPADMNFYAQEIALVRSLDPGKPIYTTVSGELSTWGKLARMVDSIGTSLYRVTYNKAWGYFTYPYPALFYRLHAWLTTQRTGTPVYISELQMEPWGRVALIDLPVAEQLKYMGIKEGQRNLQIAEQTGLSPVYLWGVEWWYWLKVKHNNDQWWNLIKNAVNQAGSVNNDQNINSR